MSYGRGDIVWVKFPFSDASSNKMRPELTISNNIVNETGDYLLMQVTTRLHDDEFALMIAKDNYKEKPLLKQSELRLHKIILHESLIESKIASVNYNFLDTVLEKLIRLLS